jgi:hypothetical protein
MTTLCVCLHPFFVLKHLHTPHSAHMHIHIHALEPILCIQWIMENTGDDKRPFTSILIWASLSDLSLPGKEGQLEGQVSYSFGTGRVILSRSVTSWLGRQEPPPPLSLWLTDGLGMYLCELDFFWGLYFLFFVHYCIHGHLFSECLWYTPDGGWGGCLLPVN